MQSSPPKRKQYQDDWGTGAREGYEDRGAFRPPRAKAKQPGSPLLRMLGILCIVVGICWGTYLVTSGSGGIAVLQENRGPVAIIAIGVVGALLGKYLRM